jgi:hypothetical protein
VEVYFPKENAWIPFDPTPSAGRFAEQPEVNAFGQFSKYLEALETFWIKYVVSYDNQEQVSLFRSIRNNFKESQTNISSGLSQVKLHLTEWWQNIRGDRGFENSWKAAIRALGYMLALVACAALIIWLLRMILHLKLWAQLKRYLQSRREDSIIEFYERMQKILAKQGMVRQSSQTPLEFAFSTSIPEAIKITESYNRVRFGEKNLKREELREIENWLGNLENGNQFKDTGK